MFRYVRDTTICDANSGSNATVLHPNDELPTVLVYEGDNWDKAYGTIREEFLSENRHSVDICRSLSFSSTDYEVITCVILVDAY